LSFIDQVLQNLAIEPRLVAMAIKSFAIGLIGAFLSIVSSEYLIEKNKDVILKGFWKKLVFSILGGICATLAQMIEGSDKTLILQALTIGASWPRFVSRFKKQHDFKEFVDSDEDVPTKRIR
jgi:hypothetical protein